MALRIERAGIFAPVPRDPTGQMGPTRRQAEGPEWRTSSRGRYVRSYVDGSAPQQRIVEAAVTLPPGGAVTGWAGLNWMGASWFSGLAGDGRTLLPVPLAIGHDRTVRPRPGIEVSEEWIGDGELEQVDGLWVTNAVRSVCFEVRRARTLGSAVVTLDMAAFDDFCSLDQVARYVEGRLAGRPYINRVRRALEHADENCWSPREAGMRKVWTVDGGFPRPLCNVPIFSPDGTHLLTPDLFDPVNGVVGEYDGRSHLTVVRQGQDVDREELVRDIGLERVTMVTADNGDVSGFLRRLDSAYRRARKRSPSGAWTLEQPDWWVDTSTVERRRALSASERARWLRRRAA